MTTDPLTTVSIRQTPASQPARPDQVRNAAGGYVFTVDDRTQLRRFLMLGVAGGTYHISEAQLTADNAAVVLDFARENPEALIAEILDVSLAGRAPRQNPTLFALAAVASLPMQTFQDRVVAMARARLTATGNDRDRLTNEIHAIERSAAELRETVSDAFMKVVRTGTHLATFVTYATQFRGWGRFLRTLVARWFLDRPVDELAYQVTKYRTRLGWSPRDLIWLSHATTVEPDRTALFDLIFDDENARAAVVEHPSLHVVEGFLRAQLAAGSPRTIAQIVRDYGLSWEMLPDSAMNDTGVWAALLDVGVPQTALMRQLPRLTRLDMLDPLSPDTVKVVAQLTDAQRLTKARVHPINVLVAARTYASGRSARGSGTWQPSAPIVDALDAAFYAAYGGVEPSGKRLMLCLDVSGSMTYPISDMPLSCREASAAIALVTAATEPNHMIVAFSAGNGGDAFSRTYPGGLGHPDDSSGRRWASRDGVTVSISPLSISPRQRLDDVIRAVSGLPFSGTDCSLPMQYALADQIEVDVFVIYTDNETWFGDIHPFQALRQYREQSGIDAKLVVVSMTANGHSIADPSDPRTLDVVGFDTAVPSAISAFARDI